MTNPNGRFGIHGGQYIPETLMNAVILAEPLSNIVNVAMVVKKNGMEVRLLKGDCR